MNDRAPNISKLKCHLRPHTKYIIHNIREWNIRMYSAVLQKYAKNFKYNKLRCV